MPWLSNYCNYCFLAYLLISTRNPGLDQIWSTLDQNWSNPKIFFWDFWSGFFAKNSILVNYYRSWKNILQILIPSCIFRLDQKWSRVDHFWSNPGFLVLIFAMLWGIYMKNVSLFHSLDRWKFHIFCQNPSFILYQIQQLQCDLKLILGIVQSHICKSN